jgi:WD40 repeat protein
MTAGKGLKIWDLSTGEEVRTIGDKRTFSIAASPDKRSVLVGSDSHTIL